MFEPAQYDGVLHGGEELRPCEPYEPVKDIIKVSRMVWGEHCIECAAPACYSTCDLYEPRPDKRCRRLVFGLFENKAFSSWRGCGAEVHFKQWAKLEARGNFAMEPVWKVRAWERLMRFGAPVMNFIGGIGARVTGDDRWAHLSHSISERWIRALHRKKGSDGQPDGFLLEIYNISENSARIQLVITAVAPAPEEVQCALPGERFVETFDLPHGYSRHFVDRERFHLILDRRGDFDVSLIPESESADRLVILSADFVTLNSLATPAKDKNPGVKCVVWDLDNTMWDGILLENENVQLRPHVLDVIKTLDERGIVHSIASKNDHDHALKRLEALGIAEYFIRPKINWMPKSQNVSQIAKEINIGIDTLVFVDDNPFELDEVTQAHPDVAGVQADRVAEIPKMQRFEGSSSSDAKNRRRYYQDAAKRQEVQQELGQDFFAFLRQSEIKLTVVPYDSSRLDRVAELVQRTNQLNYSGQKYQRDALLEIIADESLQEFVLICSDRYGSYGTVGFGIVEFGESKINIHDFMLSCRVQGKFIEQAFFTRLVEIAGVEQIERIWVNYRPTKRNAPAWNVLSSMGFLKLAEGQGAILDLAGLETPLECDFIEVLAQDTE